MIEDEIDNEVETGLRIMREHMLADHIVRVTDQAEVTEFIASLFGVIDGAADALANNAMLLRRVPDLREPIADQLDEMSSMLRALVPVARDDEEGSA